MFKRLCLLFSLFALLGSLGTAVICLTVRFPLSFLLLMLFCLFLLLAAFCAAGKEARSWQKKLESINPEHPEQGDPDSDLAPLKKRLDDFNRETARRLEELRREHETRDELRREFTANVSHELKTPLTSISGYGELLRDGLAAPGDVPRFAAKICDESGRLLTLVGDILQLSKLDAGVKTAREDIDLYGLCEQVLTRLELPAGKKHLRLSLEGEHLSLRGDPGLTEQILFNLCDNAVKYNREGGSVTVTLRSCVDGVEVSVADTGIGIAESDIKHLFERFYRVDKSRSREEGGTGLGLSIVKHAAMSLGALVSLESTPGVGTTVRLLF